MRLLFAVRGLYPRELGGAQRHCYHLVREAAAAGAEVTVVHPYAERVLAPPVREYPLGGDARRYRGLLAFTRAVATLLKREEGAFDVLYSDGIALMAHLPARKRPCIFNPHGLPAWQGGASWSIKTWVARRNIRRCARQSDFTISLGGKLTDLIRDRLGVPEERILELPNGVDLAPAGGRRAARVRGSYLFVGSLVEHKGIRQLAEVIRRCEDAAASFIIVGDGSQAGLLRSLNDSRVRLLGKVSDPQVLAGCYDSAECLLMTSLRDGMPTVILEAMARSLPIIATDVGAVRTMVDDGRNGYVVPSDDVPGLLAAMARFSRQSADEREEMGRLSRAKAERFAWPSVARRFLEHAENACRKWASS